LYNERLYDLFKEEEDITDPINGESLRRSQSNRGLEIRQDKLRGVFVSYLLIYVYNMHPAYTTQTSINSLLTFFFHSFIYLLIFHRYLVQHQQL
jgi:hypothetical protein